MIDDIGIFIIQQSSYKFLFTHEFDKIVQEDWPCVSFTVILTDIFDSDCELIHHLPKIFVAFEWFLCAQALKIKLELLWVFERVTQKYFPQCFGILKIHW